jgi:hypothetical protein
MSPEKVSNDIETLKRYVFGVAHAVYGNPNRYAGPAGFTPEPVELFPLLDRLISFIHAQQLPIDPQPLRDFACVETRRLYGTPADKGVVVSGIHLPGGQKITAGEWLPKAKALDDRLNDLKALLPTLCQGQKVKPFVSERLVIDPRTRTVTLDGTPYPVDDLKTLLVYKAIAEVTNPPVTNAQIMQAVRGVKGHKVIAQRLKTLPPILGATVETTTAGHSLILCRKPPS